MSDGLSPAGVTLAPLGRCGNEAAGQFRRSAARAAIFRVERPRPRLASARRSESVLMAIILGCS